MQKMPKRKNKFLKNIFSYFFIGLICFYIYYVFLRNREYQEPEGIFRGTYELKPNLYYEWYLNLDCDCQDLFLTDSLNYRLFVLSYNRENKEAKHVILDSHKVTFQLVYMQNGKKLFKTVSEYTFEELKKKNNLKVNK